MTVTIRTNNQARPLLNAFELGSDYNQVREEFSFLSDDDFGDGAYFKFKGQWYSMCDFIRTDSDLLSQGWEGILTDTAFSATVIKTVPGDFTIVVGSLFC